MSTDHPEPALRADITTLNLDHNGADIPADTSFDMSYNTSHFGGPTSNPTGAGDITGLVLDRDGADVVPADPDRWGPGPNDSMRVCGKGARARLTEIAMSLLDGFNARNFSAWRGLLADDFTAIYAPTGPAVLDAQLAEAVNTSFLLPYDDITFVTDRIVVSASCDVVVIHWTASGTHTDPLVTPSGRTILPTGLQWSVPGAYTAEIRDGQIVREWTHWDQLAGLLQLGLISPP